MLNIWYIRQMQSDLYFNVNDNIYEFINGLRFMPDFLIKLFSRIIYFISDVPRLLNKVLTSVKISFCYL